MPFGGFLVDEDEDACCENEESEADGVGDPDKGCCDERHTGRVDGVSVVFRG